MPLSPAAAAKKAGVSRSVISRALKDGTLHGVRKNNGHWSVMDNDLEDWMARTTIRAQDDKPAPTPKPQTEAPQRHPDDIAKIAALENLYDESRIKRSEAEVELARVSGRLTTIEEVLDDLKADRNSWKEQAETLAAREPSHTEIRPGIIARIFGRG